MFQRFEWVKDEFGTGKLAVEKDDRALYYR